MLRLTGGEFRGRPIHTLPDERTRPTQAKLRQALFNSIQVRIPDARVLDLFAGSGALGFEALSRGAASAVFVEQARPAVKIIEKNIGTLGVKDRAVLIGESVAQAFEGRLAGLLERHGPFDLIFADPPYAGGWEMRLLEEFPWERLLVPGGLFCLEWGVKKSVISELPEESGVLVKTREKNYGDSVLTTYCRRDDAAPAATPDDHSPVKDSSHDTSLDPSHDPSEND